MQFRIDFIDRIADSGYSIFLGRKALWWCDPSKTSRVSLGEKFGWRFCSEAAEQIQSAGNSNRLRRRKSVSNIS